MIRAQFSTRQHYHRGKRQMDYGVKLLTRKVWTPVFLHITTKREKSDMPQNLSMLCSSRANPTLWPFILVPGNILQQSEREHLGICLER
ncbi:hypothetical protein QC764_0073570 [Podospora pseudoanserina]|uniref:Uncharacterized protein n=1 Tax=Podospora pseudoanserina TaxID=2609844 RepID=A0ABR0I447_9PEZI|nr:hypothetical protein QC764_0073570 [Podospora pseudoanserina]